MARQEAMEANLAEALAELARTREEHARALGMLAEVQHHLKATLQREQQANSEIERLQALVARRGGWPGARRSLGGVASHGHIT